MIKLFSLICALISSPIFIYGQFKDLNSKKNYFSISKPLVKPSFADKRNHDITEKQAFDFSNMNLSAHGLSGWNKKVKGSHYKKNGIPSVIRKTKLSQTKNATSFDEAVLDFLEEASHIMKLHQIHNTFRLKDFSTHFLTKIYGIAQ